MSQFKPPPQLLLCAPSLQFNRFMRWRYLPSLFIMILAGQRVWALPEPQRMIEPGKKDVIEALRKLQKTNLDTLQEIDREFDEKLKATRKIQISANDNSQALNHIPDSLRQIKERKHEYQMRRDFIDQVIFQIDSRWNGENLRSFLENNLLEMASNDVKDEYGSASIAAFSTYLSMALRDLPERNENLVQFIQGYIDYSSLSAPKSPQNYLRERSYLNGSTAYTAADRRRDKVGDIVDRKIQSLLRSEKKQQGTLTMKASQASNASPTATKSAIPNVHLEKPFHQERQLDLGWHPDLNAPELNK